MAYYLQMDGVDDRIVLPSLTFTEIVMDVKVNSKASFERYWSLPLGAEYLQVASGGINDQWSSGVNLVYWNGVAQTNLSLIIPLSTRGVVRSLLTQAKTAAISIFANGTGNIAHGDLWNIKVYNGATVVAHYDMTLGNVQDQTGNGNHATLIGGTWIDESPVTPSTRRKNRFFGLIR